MRDLPRNVYRTASGRFAARYTDFGVGIYIASFDTAEEAAQAVLEREATANRLRRRSGSIYEMRQNYFLARGPSPERPYIGCFRNRWAAERALANLCNREKRRN